jgi:DNA-binding transcriptional LysR family regulator
MPAHFEDLPSMALFAQVVELRSFSEAARRSGVAKSAVSKRISLLEERLGVQLLTRSTRKLALTEDGMRFYEHCAAMVSAASAAEDSVSASSHSARGPLRVNGPVTFTQMHLARAVAMFLAAQPEVTIDLATDDRMVDVVEGGFDVVVRIARLEASSIVARRIAVDRLVVCASPAYLARRGIPEAPEELVGHNCLHYGLVPLAGEWRFRGAEGAYSVPVRGNLTCTDGTALRQAAVAGLGLAVLPSFMIADDVAADRLRIVLEGQRRAEIGIYAVFASRKHLPLRTRLFLDFLSKHFEAGIGAVTSASGGSGGSGGSSAAGRRGRR